MLHFDLPSGNAPAELHKQQMSMDARTWRSDLCAPSTVWEYCQSIDGFGLWCSTLWCIVDFICTELNFCKKKIRSDSWCANHAFLCLVLWMKVWKLYVLLYLAWLALSTMANTNHFSSQTLFFECFLKNDLLVTLIVGGSMQHLQTTLRRFATWHYGAKNVQYEHVCKARMQLHWKSQEKVFFVTYPIENQ